MKTVTKIYEDNSGGIHAIVFEDGVVTNVITGFQHEQIPLSEFLQSALYGFEGADDYDPNSFSGWEMNDAAQSIEKMGFCIAEFDMIGEIAIHAKYMGTAGKILFGLNED